MKPRYVDIGICGLSCRLCPRFHTEGTSLCLGCKSEVRMSAGCPFITCALKRKGLEFCWDCDESGTCAKWKKHRDIARERDTFTCYASLNDNIDAVSKRGLDAFIADQDQRLEILGEMLGHFNEGRSKTYYCIAATRLDPAELTDAISKAKKSSASQDVRQRSKVLHTLLDELASRHAITLALRK